jgi:RecA/RadA recombinase
MEKRVPITCEAVASVYNKKKGKGTVTTGTEEGKVRPKLPFGVFLATYGSGGGAPMWSCSRLKGAEGSGKTTMAISAMRQAELLCWRCFNIADYCTCSQSPLKMRALYVDSEGALDPEWINTLGVSGDYFFVTRTSEGGEALDVAESMLKADDLGLVIIDSIAHLLPPVEVERSIGDSKVASHAKLITGAVNKLQVRLNSERQREHPCLVICTNQLRYTIGGYGPNEIESGGQSFKHWFSLGIRMSKLSTDEAKYKSLNSAVKLFQRHGLIWDKERVTTLLKAAEFFRARADIYNPKDPSELLYKKGFVMDDNIIYSYLQEHNMLVDGYRVPDLYDCKQAGELKSELRKCDNRYYQLHIELTRRAKDGGCRMPSMPEPDNFNEEGDDISV